MHAPLIGLSRERSESVRYRCRNSVTIVINDIMIGFLDVGRNVKDIMVKFAEVVIATTFIFGALVKNGWVYETRKFLKSAPAEVNTAAVEY